MNKDKKTVFVGISGGVDSSVSAALLKDQGYNVVGVFIRTWTPDFIECTWRDERRDAMRVCAHLDIPFLECDAEETYKKGVADYMIEEYKKGNTPNPDVMCNRMVKFGVFWKFAKAHGALFIATGHYAVNSFSPCEGGELGLGTQVQDLEYFVIKKRKVYSSCEGVSEGRGGEEISSTPPAKSHLPLAGEEKIQNHLRKSPDSSKDQSYFLWTLTSEDLSHTLFPIGHLHKTEVRELAKKYKIPVATKKDSQGVCFLGPLDMKDFLKHYIKSKKGDVLLARREGGNEKGKVIGTHDGAAFFTLGERHGFTINKNIDDSKPFYIIAKDIKNNTITVSASPENSFSQVLGRGRTRGQTSSKKNFSGSQKNTINTNWTIIPEKNKKYTAQIRYHGELLDCKIDALMDNKAHINFDKNVLVDSGQSIVVYDGDICLGGGIVS